MGQVEEVHAAGAEDERRFLDVFFFFFFLFFFFVVGGAVVALALALAVAERPGATNPGVALELDEVGVEVHVGGRHCVCVLVL
jgi:hypothetical protein